MKRLTLLLVLAGAAALQTPPAHAARLGVPSGVYPSGAHVTYRPDLSNAAMDCMWGFMCEDGLPLFHRNTQDTLHRLDGWAQFAGIRRQGRVSMAFELFVSHYASEPNLSGMPWSELAFLDLQKALNAQGYQTFPDAKALTTSTAAGGSLLMVRLDGRQDLVVMARWSGSTEIEGIAMYDHGSTTRAAAWTSLSRQIAVGATARP